VAEQSIQAAKGTRHSVNAGRVALQRLAFGSSRGPMAA
jgi:hypothetical protein